LKRQLSICDLTALRISSAFSRFFFADVDIHGDAYPLILTNESNCSLTLAKKDRMPYCYFGKQHFVVRLSFL